MQISLKILISVILLMTVISSALHSQEKTIQKVELEFIKPNVEVKPGEIFHNILIVENKSEATETFDIFINSPNHWKLIGESSKRFILLAGERVYLPVQVASSGQSKGGVGYAITAVLNDINGNMVKAESCLLSIPRQGSIESSITNNQKYFDLETQIVNFSLKIKNTGNVDQQISLKTIPSYSLETLNNTPDITRNIHLEPKNDTTLNFKLRLKDNTDTKYYSSHNAEIVISGSDTTYNHTAWFHYLDWNYINHIPDSERPLVIEYIANGIFSDGKTTHDINLYGNILFKKQRALRYYFRYQNRNTAENRNTPQNRIWYNFRTLAEYSDKKKLKVGIGDYTGAIEQILYGRGAWVELRPKPKHTISSAVTKRLYYNGFAAGLKYSYRLKSSIITSFGGAYSKNNTAYSDIISGFSEVSLASKKYGNTSLLLGYSQTDFFHPDFPSNHYDGYGLKFNYQNKIAETLINSRIAYGSPLYVGIKKGRLNISVSSHSVLSNRFSLSNIYTKQDFKSAQIINNNHTNTSINIYDNYRSELYYNLDKNIRLLIGPEFEHKSTNNYSDISDNNRFSTFSYGGNAGIRISENYTANYYSFNAFYGLKTIISLPETVEENTDFVSGFPYIELKLNIKHGNLSLYTSYQQGPRTIGEEYAFILSPQVIKTITIMPRYERYIYQKAIKLNLTGNYRTNLTAKSSRFSLNSKLTWELKKGWSIFLEDMFSLIYQSPYSAAGIVSDNSFTSNFLRFGIKKVFDFNQPRIKYINLDAVFFRDNNGDGLRTADEPGVSNVLTGLKRVPQEDEDPGLKSEFNNVELLSEFEGKIAVQNIPSGTYEISYIPTNGREGNFITDRAVKIVKIDNDSTLYIPFTDKNKVFGNVIIKQAEHTILENPPLDNIKIVAKGDGKSQSTLTDKNGYFEMYIPVADYYRIETSNIDPEHYRLQQPFYIVKFNGYKEFELNFVFEEKERKIQFDEDLSYFDSEEYSDSDTEEPTDAETDTEEEDIDINVQPLRQINVKGEIRDEKTMNPVHARISIVNQNNNVPITETVSSQRTGIYAASMISSEPLYINVKAKGYWTHKENLRTGKITTFDNINKDIRLSPIAVGQKMETPELTFEQNQSSLSPRAQVELENLLGILHENSHVTINIEGHSDGMEALDEADSNISLKRAQAVAEYLKRGGIRPERITNVVGKSDKSPKITEVDEQTRTANRRVEIIISGF
jgi:outer membrane protein OmpA-like peptidoglycan-associated protein